MKSRIHPAPSTSRMPHRAHRRRDGRTLVPPPQFADATLDSYRPDRDYPLAGRGGRRDPELSRPRWHRKGGLFKRAGRPETKPGIYLDGGFGVGKTHLLAAAVAR